MRRLGVLLATGVAVAACVGGGPSADRSERLLDSTFEPDGSTSRRLLQQIADAAVAHGASEASVGKMPLDASGPLPALNLTDAAAQRVPSAPRDANVAVSPAADGVAEGGTVPPVEVPGVGSLRFLRSDGGSRPAPTALPLCSNGCGPSEICFGEFEIGVCLDLSNTDSFPGPCSANERVLAVGPAPNFIREISCAFDYSGESLQHKTWDAKSYECEPTPSGMDCAKDEHGWSDRYYRYAPSGQLEGITDAGFYGFGMECWAADRVGDKVVRRTCTSSCEAGPELTCTDQSIVTEPLQESLWRPNAYCHAAPVRVSLAELTTRTDCGPVLPGPGLAAQRVVCGSVPYEFDARGHVTLKASVSQTFSGDRLVRQTDEVQKRTAVFHYDAAGNLAAVVTFADTFENRAELILETYSYECWR